MKDVLKVGSLIAERGEKKQGFVKILDTKYNMPITIINGIHEGKTILITAGVHGGEYPCIKTAMDLAKEIDPNEVSGQIILVHPVNVAGFIGRNTAVMPVDNKNILRVFPGDQNGTISDKIAYFITHELQDQSDFYLDLHGGDINEDLLPHIYYPGVGEEWVVKTSKKIAKLFDVPYYIKSNTRNGTYTSAALRGVPSLLIERGGCGLCKEEDVKAYKKDILNVLSALEFIKKEITEKQYEPVEIYEAEYIEALNSGCWICYVKAGETIKEGQKLGEVMDFFGNIVDTYYAKYDGIVLYHTVAFSVTESSSLIAYGKDPNR